ncbi:diversity-generating retroelement protein Avd [Castellaniella denitrificans]|uniref:diversity-generating retroelement protein Avd n=1 Tax=Castellaniella denitrificans TaxID=56119 RepID=UPI003608D852
MKDPHLTLLTKLEELDAYTHQVLHQFPRLERHLLCAEMRTSTNRFLRLATVAWKRRQKAAALFDLDVEIEVFRLLIRKAHRLGYINDHRLMVWMKHTNEIGQIVGGWIKHETTKRKGEAMQ